MKRIQRTLALLLATVILLATFSLPAFAATSYKVATLKTGTWYKLPSNYKLKTIYQLKLTADSIITVSWKNNKSNEACVLFYDNKKADDDYIKSYWLYEDWGKSGSNCFALSKGTYYIKMYEGWEEKPTAQIKISVNKAVNKTNYCRSKAILLKANQMMKIAQTADYCYDRWYKITVPKKKTVTITTNEGHADDIVLYDTKMNSIDCAYGSTKVIAEEKIPKGTYFIRVIGGWSGQYLGDYISLKWN